MTIKEKWEITTPRNYNFSWKKFITFYINEDYQSSWDSEDKLIDIYIDFVM
jgi:hypothetical protein